MSTILTQSKLDLPRRIILVGIIAMGIVVMEIIGLDHCWCRDVACKDAALWSNSVWPCLLHHVQGDDHPASSEAGTRLDLIRGEG